MLQYMLRFDEQYDHLYLHFEIFYIYISFLEVQLSLSLFACGTLAKHVSGTEQNPIFLKLISVTEFAAENAIFIRA